MSINNEIGQLLYRHLQGTLTPEEQQELDHWASQSFSNRELMNSLGNEEELIMKLREHMPENREALRIRILERVKQGTQNQPEEENNTSKVRRIYPWKWIAASAMLLAAGAWLYMQQEKTPATTASIPSADSLIDIAPGKNGAVLTLQNGQTISLDSLNGAIMESNTAIAKMQNGQLQYNNTAKNNDTAAWNMVSTTRGRQFTIQLSDGTRVWLNAGSSLRYPVVFTGKERDVTISGEAYFEVAANPKQPFSVSTENGLTIEVLGTSFNVNAYSDESSIRATLLQGSIRLKKDGAARILKPGQQAVVKEQIEIKENINTDQVIAWKNGFFNLNGIRLDEFMRQLSRWYDIEVSWEGELLQKQFYGEIYRGENLSQVLQFLQQSGIRFRKENNGKKLVLTN